LGYNLAIEYLADYEKTWMLDSFRDLNERVLHKDIDWIFLEVNSWSWLDEVINTCSNFVCSLTL
jgi:hypothetical protein